MTDSAGWSEHYAAGGMHFGVEPNQFVVGTCTPLRPGRALDLGAGEGRNSFWLARRGWDVTAVDFTDIAISRITALAALDGLAIDAVVADVLSYHPRLGSYQLLLLSYLQLSLPQLRRALANAVPGLAPGGRVVIIAHDSSNLITGVGGPRNPDLLHTPEQVARVLKDLGLSVQRAEVVEREVSTENGLRYAYDHVVEAVRAAAG